MQNSPLRVPLRYGLIVASHAHIFATLTTVYCRLSTVY